MSLDWSTFFLQIINFLALVWILKHFLYKPILATLAQRRAAIAKTLEQAQAAEARAAALLTDYETRQAAWEQEKAAARADFAAAQEQEHARQMAALTLDLAKERERNAAQEARRLSELQQQIEAAAMARSARFASALLGRLAGPALEAQLLELLIEDLPHLPEAQVAGLRSATQASTEPARVISAYPLNLAQREALAQELSAQLDHPLRIDFTEDRDLIAGLRIVLGPWQLNLSLADELRQFAAAGSHVE
ncbi:F0F1 ATP synthase subunit delta [Uliginosibacterium flavum]|uniref:ATP synthase subunit b n=2 Tax=Uliginosibacterium flavum TaxID=1396831 RepID=A0ABV2TMJ7_9RHOO